VFFVWRREEDFGKAKASPTTNKVKKRTLTFSSARANLRLFVRSHALFTKQKNTPYRRVFCLAQRRGFWQSQSFTDDQESKKNEP